MSFWAQLPCPTHILITGNVKFSAHRHRHILYFHITKRIFSFMHWFYRKVVICECPLHWHQIRYQFPREDAGGFSREYILNIPSVS